MGVIIRRVGAEDYGRYLKVLIGGDSGAGKGLPLDTPVATPGGWRCIGDLEVGDPVIGANGSTCQVTHIFDRGEQPVFSVLFSDGAEIVCDADHLWAVQTRKMHYETGGWKVFDTRSLWATELKTQINGYKFWVPVVGAVQFDKIELPVEPYLLGVILANGGLTQGQCVVTTPDEEIIREIQRRDPRRALRETTVDGYCRRWTVAHMQPVLRGIGLAGKKSAEKFVPSAYLTADEDSRRALLAGLCDCDGSKSLGNRRPRFHTTSPMLLEAVIALVRSLGGVCGDVHVDSRDEHPCFTVSIAGLDPFILARKAGSERPAWRAIESVEPTGMEYTRCIKVDAPDELFVAKDYIVTHNTRFASTFPDPLYLATDPSLDSVLDRAPAYAEVQESDQMTDVLMKLRQGTVTQEKLFGFVPKTIVLDTADDLQRIFIRERLASTHKDSLTIQDYGWLGDQMRELVRNFRNLPMHVIVTAHLKDDKDDETGKITVKPGLVGQFADQMSAMFGLSFLIRTQQTTKVIDGQSKRVEVKIVQTSGDAMHPWVKDRFGVLPKPDYESDLTLDFERIFKAVFERTLPEGVVIGNTGEPVKEPKPASSVDDAARAAAERKKTTTTSKAAAAKKEATPALLVDDEPPPLEPPSPPSPPAEPEPSTATSTEESATEASPPTAASEPERELTQPGETPPAELEDSASESVPEAGTESADPKESMICTSGGPQKVEGCGNPIENEDQRDLSWLRFRTTLCRSCFQAAKAK